MNDVTQGGNRSSLSYEVPPGTDFGDKVTLFNLGNVPLTFRVYPTDAFNTGDGSFELLRGDQKATELGTWVTLPQNSVTLAPKTQVTMPITIKVPITAAPGDHAGGILASNEAENMSPDGKVIALDRRTGVRLYVRVAGPLAPKLTVEKLATKYGHALNPLGGAVEVTYRVENRGNVRTGGRQRVSVSGPFGLLRRQQASTEVPELLPGQSATFRVRFKGIAATGLVAGRVRLDAAPVGGTALKPATWTSNGLAVPFTVLAMVIMVGFLLIARRGYLRRQHQPQEAELSAR